MEKCISCGQSADFSFQALEVRTLHIRDLQEEKRVQALGDFKEFGICNKCAQKHLDEILKRGNLFNPQFIIYSMIFFLGLFLSITYWTSNGVFRMVGLAALVCGILGNITIYKKNTATRAVYNALSPAQQLAKAAWERVAEKAPAKDDINDLTYIPVTEETLALKNGDLMVLYKLLPAIAIEAHKALHLRK